MEGLASDNRRVRGLTLYGSTEKLYTVSEGLISRRGARNRSDSGSVQPGDGCYRVSNRAV